MGEGLWRGSGAAEGAPADRYALRSLSHIDNWVPTEFQGTEWNRVYALDLDKTGFQKSGTEFVEPSGTEFELGSGTGFQYT